MTNIMMRRRTALSGLSLAVLAACATKKSPIIGKQIPVIAADNGMDVAVDAPAVTLPAATPLANWPQGLAGPVLINGLLVLTNDHGEIALVDAVAGKLTQTAKLGGPADMPPIAAAGMLLQLTRNAKLTAYG